jgi:hypothetical protein
VVTDAVRAGHLQQSEWRPAWAALIQDAENVKAGQLPQFGSTRDVIDAGTTYAKRQTQQGELGELGKKARTFATVGNMPVVGNLITPYFNSPWNANLRLMERTPGVGAMMNSQRGFDKVYDQAMGSALVLGLGGIAAQGALTGNGPSDPEKRKEMMSQGWRPYSSLVNGVYVPNRVIWGVAAPLANVAGDFHDGIAYQKTGGDIGDLSTDMLGRFGSQLKQQPYLQGISDALSLFDPTQPMSTKLAQYAASTATRMVPYASTARAASTSQDPMERTTDRGKGVDFGTQVGQRIESALGMRGALPVAQDVLGRPQENPQQGWKALFAKSSPEKADPIIKAFLDNQVDIGSPRQDLTISLYGPDGKVSQSIPMPLTPAEQRTWNQLRGDALINLVGPATKDPEFAKAPPDVQAKWLQTQLQTANDYATRTIRGQLPDPEITKRIEPLKKAS